MPNDTRSTNRAALAALLCLSWVASGPVLLAGPAAVDDAANAPQVQSDAPPAGDVAGGPPLGTGATATAPAQAGSGAGPAGFYVAGLTPDRRPDGAARIVALRQSAEWSAAALHGISQPIPPSLGFIKDIGAWHPFFANPGMTGPYDIRGWHAAD